MLTETSWMQEFTSLYYGYFTINIDSGIQDKVEAAMGPDAMSCRSAQGRVEPTRRLASVQTSQNGQERPLLFLIRDHIGTQKPRLKVGTPKLLVE